MFQHFSATLLHIAQLSAWLVILAMVFVPLERWFALRPMRLLRGEIAVDLGYYFLSNLLPTILMAVPLAGLAYITQNLIPPEWLLWSHALPWWGQIGCALIVVEIGTYWGHRWSHEIPFLWRFHAVHHSAENLDWLVNTRAHPIDMVLGRLCGLIPLYLLGLAQPAASGTALALTVTLITTFWGFFVHANVRWRFGWVEHLLATPAFHHWHHVRDDYRNTNYATMFPWIDRLFGSLHLPKRAWPIAYGIDTPMPATLAGQLIDPLLGINGPDPARY
jgi:sterol desaturase/sphingolipid hydroxylase (fatty acid hydroxylase superfamily)